MVEEDIRQDACDETIANTRETVTGKAAFAPKKSAA
jgi:hypothetical protein